METTQLIRDLAKGFAVATQSDHQHDPTRMTAFARLLEVGHPGALSLLAEHLGPILDKYLTDNVVVSRKTLELLGKASQLRGSDELLELTVFAGGGGIILETDAGDTVASFGPSFYATAEEAILSLLDPKEPKPDAAQMQVLLLSGVPDPTGSTLLWEGKKFSIVPDPED